MSYKLTYFNLRGRAEPIRLIFALAGQEYHDVRVQNEDWPALKPSLPWGQLPVLQISDKANTQTTTISQTVTIARFLARRSSLTGANEFEAAKCDELVDAMTDLQSEWVRIRFEEKDEERKAKLTKTLVKESIPRYLEKFDKIQAKNGGNFMVGESVTWADAWIANALERFQDGLDANCLEKFPNLRKMKTAFFAIPKVQEYVARRSSP